MPIERSQLTHHRQPATALYLALSIVILGALSSCGGGGGSSVNSDTATGGDGPASGSTLADGSNPDSGSDAAPASGSGGGGGSSDQTPPADRTFGLQGTVASDRASIDNRVQLRATTGERSAAPIDTLGRFSRSEVQGSGPWLLRVNLGNGQWRYALAYYDGNLTGSYNIHAYSDALARQAFGALGLDIDTAFDSAEPLPVTLDQDSYVASTSRLESLLARPRADWGFESFDVMQGSFRADGSGFDAFLQANPAFSGTRGLNIQIRAPQMGLSSMALTDRPADSALGTVDDTAPGPVADLRAGAESADTALISWQASNDASGLALYEVLRDGVVLGSTALTQWRDTGLVAGVGYQYTVEAVDSAGNRSTPSATAALTTSATPDNTTPAPTGPITVVPELYGMTLSWSHAGIDTVAAFELQRTGPDGPIETLARTTSGLYLDTTIQPGQIYCYAVLARAPGGTASSATEPACAESAGAPLGP